MGILSKILAGDDSAKHVGPEPRAQDVADVAADQSNDDRPMSPCHAGHQSPYGLNFWRDSYGSWHCYDCSPPATMAMVKTEVFLGSESNQNHAGRGDDRQQLTQADFQLAAGFEILAVQSPAGVWAFAPETTQAQRREAVECSAWFERMDKWADKRAARVPGR